MRRLGAFFRIELLSPSQIRFPATQKPNFRPFLKTLSPELVGTLWKMLSAHSTGRQCQAAQTSLAEAKEVLQRIGRAQLHVNPPDTHFDLGGDFEEF